MTAPEIPSGTVVAGTSCGAGWVRDRSPPPYSRQTRPAAIDGRVVRGSDQVLVHVAERWQVGEAIEVLYRPDRDDDSVVISTI